MPPGSPIVNIVSGGRDKRGASHGAAVRLAVECGQVAKLPGGSCRGPCETKHCRSRSRAAGEDAGVSSNARSTAVASVPLRNAPGQAATHGSDRLLAPGADVREITDMLADACTRQGQPGRIEVRETNASRVFLTPTEVYKLKKPVDLGFLDYSTLRRRSRMCRQEVALNRRLAPNVYIGIDRVTRARDGLVRLNGPGLVADYLVHMRRLPDDRSLDGLLHSGSATDEDLRSVGARIGAFHWDAVPVARGFGPSTFIRNARENLLQLQSCAGATLPVAIFEELAAYFEDVRSRTRRLLDKRAEAGHIRDGHGDLRAEHIYLENQVTIIDCIEFNARYRVGDTALDFAFLAMDLAASGYPDRVSPLVQSYESAAADDVAGVLPLYCWYRALVRAKVAFILEGDEGVSDETRHAAALAARRHLYHALRIARDDNQPLLLAIGGLPGTGKTTLARALSGATGAHLGSADETRKRLAGLGPGVHPASAVDTDLYGGEMNRRVYGALFEAASEALRRGRNTVLDATFRRRIDRQAARSLADRRGARFLFIECEAADTVVAERLQRRVTMPDPWSDATVETFKAHRSRYEPPHEIQHSEHLRVTSTRPLLEQVDSVLSFLWM